jgi:hypothetical protein
MHRGCQFCHCRGRVKKGAKQQNQGDKCPVEQKGIRLQYSQAQNEDTVSLKGAGMEDMGHQGVFHSSSDFGQILFLTYGNWSFMLSLHSRRRQVDFSSGLRIG